MYYNKILRIWVMDSFDYFLIGAFVRSLAASYLKSYLSEKKAMERLKNSIIKKSKSVRQSNIPILNSTEMKIKKIYKVASKYRGGSEKNQLDNELSNEIFKLADDIKRLVERLARFLKKRELKGIARIFFKTGSWTSNGRQRINCLVNFEINKI